ncbi:arginase family protein [Sarocladium implicatum]|nr:arginase family protein [Sarocladium implicatum]
MRFPGFATALLVAARAVSGHSHHHDDEHEKLDVEILQQKWGTDWSFSGISTFAHLPHHKCLVDPDVEFDIGIIGAPFDTAVSYRPGARFGPRAIRASSARQISFRSFNARAGINPYTSWARIIDCGDIPVSPFDNALALRQLSEAYVELGGRGASEHSTPETSYQAKSRLVTLGGDHSVALPALRALKQRHGQPMTVLHFDAHLDTWHPGKYPSAWVDGNEDFAQSFFNHGSVFWLAGTEGLIANGSVHAGLRTRLSGGDFADYEDDSQQGWYRIPADDIDDYGVKNVIERIMTQIGTEKPVYLSVDIDVIDPGLAPATGTPEPGGWTTREMIRILRGVEGLNIVGADIVEVSPAYDDAGEGTSLAAAQVAFEIITSMVKRGAAAVGKGKAGEAKDEL